MQGRIIGPYEVGASIGRGGMGEVFKARDLKLGRDVALKVLPADLSRDPDRLARFQREARVLASLQHQNIAAIYGLEESEGQPVLAMELAAGEDLSERLRKGRLPADEVEKISQQLALGLEYAHDKGIVHRDLKPANVKVAGDGMVKILDFGLARAFTADSVAEPESGSQSYQPTITQALTGSGTVLGTAAYMSPEQARGYEVDRRSDIWAFGVILFEMMTGERLFEGQTATDTLAAVLRKEPEWEKLEGQHSALLIQICRRCLEKDPKQRLRDIGEARVALEGSSSSFVGLSTASLAAVLQAPEVRRDRRPWIVSTALGVVALAAIVAGLAGWLAPGPTPLPLVRSVVRMPAGTIMSLAAVSPGPAQISPDGKLIAYSGIDSTGVIQLLVHNLADGWTRALSGTNGASYPFWSPDSREVAFYSAPSGQLMRVPVAGGPAVRIVAATNVKGGSWNQFDQIVYAPTHMSSIMLVSADGGDPVEVTQVDQEPDFRSHRLPFWLADGRHFLYTAVSRGDVTGELSCSLRVVEAEGGKSTELLRSQASAQVVAGHLLYPHDGVLMARPLDPGSLEFTGPAFPTLSEVLVITGAHASAFSASESGVLIYMSAGVGIGGGQLARVSPQGVDIAPIGEPSTLLGITIAPDGRQLCIGLPDERSGTLDLWQIDLDRQLKTRLTFDTESEWGAVYAPDGTWLATQADRKGDEGIYRVSVSGGGGLEPLLVGTISRYPTSFSPDGSRLFYSSVDSTGMLSIGSLDVATGEAADLHPGVSYDERWASVSPDGKWLAYSSRETGASEIFVERLGGSGRWRVSASGGNHAKWAPDGSEIYYQDGTRTLRAVKVEPTADGLRFGAVREVASGVVGDFSPTYDVDPVTGDLIVLRNSSEGAAFLHLVTGWQQLLERNRKE